MNRRQILLAGAAACIAPHACAEGASLTLNGALAFVDVEMPGGSRAPFLLDTGAAVTVIDPETFKRMNGGNSRGVRLGIAGHFGTVTPAVRDLAPVSAALKQSVAGLLGSDFLSVFHVIADFASRRLVLAPGRQVKPPNGLPMRFADIPFVQAEVRHGRGILHGEFGLDTGLDSGAKLKDSMTLPMLRIATATGSIVTMNGAQNVQTGIVDAVRIGELDVVNLSAVVSQDVAPRGAGGTFAGMIGAHTFRDRVLTLDYPGGWWALSPLTL